MQSRLSSTPWAIVGPTSGPDRVRKLRTELCGYTVVFLPPRDLVYNFGEDEYYRNFVVKMLMWGQLPSAVRPAQSDG